MNNSPKLKSSSKERRDSGAIDLINNVETLTKLFGQIKSDEFTELLYALFEAHGKVNQLLTCAIEQELVNIPSASTFAFADNSILYKLMLLLIHSDFGRKYLKLALDPLFKRCTSFTPDTNESAFVEEVTFDFLKTLSDYSERCPIAFQEVLVLLDNALKKKFPNENIVPLLLCKDFLCDIIERPWDYQIFEKEDAEIASISQELLKKITFHLRTCQAQLTQLVFKLTDPATIKHLKELIESNLVINVERIRREAEERMKQYLKGDQLQKTFQDHLEFEEHKTRTLKIMEDNEDWTKMKGDKKFGIYGWVKKFDWSPLVVWRFVTTFKTSFAKFKSVIIDHEVLLKRDTRLEIGKEVRLPTTTSTRRYYYIRTAASFPVSARDFFVVRHDEWTDREGIYFFYSMEHEDYPKFPKVIRGEVTNTCGHVTVNDSDTEVKFVYTAQVDPKGSLPMWMVNKWGDGFIEELKRHHKEVAKM